MIELLDVEFSETFGIPVGVLTGTVVVVLVLLVVVLVLLYHDAGDPLRWAAAWTAGVGFDTSTCLARTDFVTVS